LKCGVDEELIRTAVEFIAFVETVISVITTHMCLETLAIQTPEHPSTTYYTRQTTTKLHTGRQAVRTALAAV